MKNLFAALAAFQGDVGPVFQDDSNPHFKSRFASTKQIMETIRPHLRKHGLAVVQFPKAGRTTARVAGRSFCMRAASRWKVIFSCLWARRWTPSAPFRR